MGYCLFAKTCFDGFFEREIKREIYGLILKRDE